MPASRSEQPTHHGRVVVGFHGSDASRQALRQAMSVARDRDWVVELLTAWPEADEAFVHDVPGRYMVARGRAMQWQDEVVDSMDPDDVSRVTAVLVNDRPVPALLARCAGADLLVLGKAQVEPQTDELDSDVLVPDVAAACHGVAPCPLVVVSGPAVEDAAPRTARRSGSSQLPSRRAGPSRHSEPADFPGRVSRTRGSRNA